MPAKLKNIKLSLFPDDLDPETDVEIDHHNLAKEFRLFSPIYYRYGLEQSYAEELVSDAKAGLKDIKNSIALEVRHSAKDKLPEKQIEALVEQNLAVIQQAKILAQYEYELRNLTHLIQTLKYKKDCLIQLGADQRKDS